MCLFVSQGHKIKDLNVLHFTVHFGYFFFSTCTIWKNVTNNIVWENFKSWCLKVAKSIEQGNNELMFVVVVY